MKKFKDKPLSEADKVRGISAYDACLFDVGKLPDVMGLQKQMDALEAQNDLAAESKKQLREAIVQRSEQFLKEFSESHYALVISNRQKIFYNKTGKVLDVTEQFRTFVTEKKLDFSLATINKD